MTPELRSALLERVQAGYSEAAIIDELISVGYTHEQAAAVYAAIVPSGVPTGLPGVGEFLRQTWQVCLTEWRTFGKLVLLALCFFVCGVTAIFALSLSVTLDAPDTFILSLIIAPLLGAFALGGMSLMLLRALLWRNEQPLFRTHVIGVLRSIVPLALVTIYLTIITQVGYALLIIPGLVASIYLLFAVLYVLRGEQFGVAALIASTRLVHGRFWAVFGRFLLINIIAGASILLLFIMGGVVLTSLLAMVPFLSFASFPFIFAGMLVALLSVGYWTSAGLVVLFESLRLVPTTVTLRVSDRSLRTLFMIMIGLAIAGLALLSFIAGFVGYSLWQW